MRRASKTLDHHLPCLDLLLKSKLCKSRMSMAWSRPVLHHDHLYRFKVLPELRQLPLCLEKTLALACHAQAKTFQLWPMSLLHSQKYRQSLQKTTVRVQIHVPMVLPLMQLLPLSSNQFLQQFTSNR